MLASSSRLECPLVGIEALVGVLARRVMFDARLAGSGLTSGQGLVQWNSVIYHSGSHCCLQQHLVLGSSQGK